MNDQNRPQIAKIVIITLIILTIIVPIIILVVGNLTSSTSLSTSISNISETLPNLPQGVVEEVEQDIFLQLSSGPNDSAKAPTSSATVREGSPLAFPANGDLSSGTFIVDIDSAEQSFLVLYNYSATNATLTEESNRSVLFCLSSPAKIIYPNSACSDNSTIPDESTLWLFVPTYTTALSTGEAISVSLASSTQADIIINACNISSAKDSALTAAKTWVAAIGFDPTTFTYETSLTYNKCLIN